jgi:hypothetical protein
MGLSGINGFSAYSSMYFSRLQSSAQGSRAANCSETDFGFGSNVNGLLISSSESHKWFDHRMGYSYVLLEHLSALVIA